MKRILLVLLLGYTVLGLVTRGLEMAGAYSCRCDAECWCRRPGLGVFRWIFPRLHTIGAITE